MKKVLHAVGIMNRGGQETYLMNILKNIDRSQIQFIFLCTHSEKGDYDKEILDLDGKLIYLPKIKNNNKVFKYIEKVNILKDFFRRNEKYDFYELHTYHAFDALCTVLGAKLGGQKKIIIHSHNTYGEHRILHLISRNILLFFDIERVACSSEAAKWMFGYKWKKAEIIPNGIKEEKFLFDINKRKKVRNKLSIEENCTLIGHVGRFEKQKNHFKILDIFKVYLNNYNAKLLLIGEGSLKEKIKDKVTELDISNSVIILDPQANINEYMMAMDVFLFPSYYEGLPLVLLEASVSGLPCLISSNITKEVDSNKNIVKCCLNEKNEVWASKLRKSEERINCLDKSFTLEETLKKIYKLYGLNYEEEID